MIVKPRDIIKRRGGELYYIVEQVVDDDRGRHLMVKEVDGDGHWLFNSKECEVIGRSRLFE
jgi:hypothetical protein